ncbi:RNA-directed DNA polymerase, eukaryota, reverse transcriptase zinc-binding domain protein [Tanacetum coccineum]
MGSFRTKEDDVAKISTSVFITNFPESCSAKELFQSCKQYGHVVDTFIPTKRSKNGRRFGFVRFINVFNEERLVNNLCTVWIDRFKLHANIARFHRPPLKEKNVIPKKDGGGKNNNSYVFKDHSGFNGGGNSYVHVVKGQTKSGIRESEVPPALVLNDECLLSKDLFKSLLRRVKQFISLANLRKAVSNEGFVDIKIQYMGELWVLLEFGSEDSMKLFQDNVEVEGIPFKLWTDNTFKRIATKWGELLDIDDQEEMCFHSKRLCIYTKTEKNIFEEFKIIFHVHDTGIYGDDSDVEEVQETLFEESEKKENNLDEEHKDKQEKNLEDPFSIYKLLKKKKDTTENEINSEQTMKYPPGFTPNEGSKEIGIFAEESRSVNIVNLSDHKAEEANKDGHGNYGNKNSKEDVSSSVCSGHFKKSGVPRTGGSILNLMDELVKVGQVMGYKMDGCLAQKAKKDWVKELCVRNKVNFMALQETKMENIELFSVKMCWGNFAFDYVHSDSVGNSGGILCVWDPNSFRKRNATVNDYFVMIRGVWCLTGNDLLIIAVYAPHDCRDKQMLWDYLTYEIGKWKGEVVIMGDFNEVRYKSDRFGSVFNVQGANVFNSFITNAGLEEVPLGGSAFTWCHKSASKMSKLDRFLVSENLLYSCPHINAITLERYLSDHRPILLREASFDYGPTPFRYFHYWNEMEGFNKVVEDAWREGPCDKTNAMLNMMMKLKFLKAKIREWNKSNMLSVKHVKAKYKDELEALEEIIDRGDGNEEIVNKRTEVVNNIHKFDKIHSSEMAQKAKVKWSIEGDENTSFFHGVLNKKQSILNIRGIMVDGNWIESPKANELESEVSNVEIKRAVWDCGTDKSPGPDGFTFGFYRRFWKIIENDVYDAVKYFFTYGNIPKGCNSSFIALIPKIPDANMEILLMRSSRGSILINGSPTEEFQFYKGLKQGDPLSPFLFILIMESLHLSFQRVVDNGMFNGIKLSSSLSISHLFYADDAVFMGQWCDGNISTLIHVLECFYRASGLRINMSKSKILGVNVDSDKVKGAASKLGCLILKTPFTYLGSKVGGSMSRVHAWNEVIDRVKNRLSKWKMKTLSIGGRLTLLKSVLGSIPIFHMSIYRAPLSVLRTLESIRSKFFKGHDINSNKASWVNWKKVLASKEKGGLGVSSLFALNRGLMFKWIWRFYTQNTLLWVRVVKAIHGDDGNVGGHVKSGAKSCWLDIVRETHALKTKGINLLDCMHVKLGNGDKTVFWEDIWIDGKTLKNRFPRIYSLESCKLITVGAKLAQPSLEYSFRRNPRGGVEQDQFNELSALVHDVSLIPMSDRWKWDLESSGDFSVASVRKIIDDKSLSDVDSKTRWIKYVPIKVNVHAWKVKTDSLPTRFNVSRRGIDIDSIMCAICDNGVETSRHLFFYCCMVRQIVRKITRWWDVPYVEVESYEDWYNWLVNLRISSMHKQMFEGVFYVMWWHLWSFRNKLIFDSKPPSQA